MSVEEAVGKLTRWAPLVLIALFAGMVAASFGDHPARHDLVPRWAAYIVMCLIIAEIVRGSLELRQTPEHEPSPTLPSGQRPESVGVFRRGILKVLTVFAYVGLIWLIGLELATAIYLWLVLWVWARSGLALSAAVGVAAYAVLRFVTVVLQMSFPRRVVDPLGWIATMWSALPM